MKKSPRHTLMNVPPECRHWRKFSVMLPSIDEPWEEMREGCTGSLTLRVSLMKIRSLYSSWHASITKSCILKPEDIEEERRRKDREESQGHESITAWEK